MEWQGNPSATVSTYSVEGMQEEWFCKSCDHLVWIKFGKEKIVGFLQSTTRTTETILRNGE